MPSPRPPRLKQSRNARFLLLLLMTVGSAAAADRGGALELPDLVLPRHRRPDISQPDAFPEADEAWTAARPGYRRIYPLAAAADRKTAWPEAEPERAGPNPDVLGIAEGGSRVAAGAEPEERVSADWTIDATADIREGARLLIGRTGDRIGTIAVEAYLAEGMEARRPDMAGLIWLKTGSLNADVRGGARDGGDWQPWGFAHAGYDGGYGTPVSASIHMGGIGGSAGGFAGRGKVASDVPLGAGGWFFRGSAEGGGWMSSDESSWIVDGSAGIGYRFTGSPVTILMGAGGGVDGTGGMQAVPYVGFQWCPGAGWSLYADSSLKTGLTAEEEYASVRQPTEEWDAGIPMFVRYRAGVRRMSQEEMSAGGEVRVDVGSFVQVSEGEFGIRDDIRITGYGDLAVPIGAARFEAEGRISGFQRCDAFPWESRIGLTWKKITAWTKIGSEDAILGDGLPGIRSDTPIIRIGSDWFPKESWNFGVYAGAGIPWNDPSLGLLAGWSG